LAHILPTAVDEVISKFLQGARVRSPIWLTHMMPGFGDHHILVFGVREPGAEWIPPGRNDLGRISLVGKGSRAFRQMLTAYDTTCALEGSMVSFAVRRNLEKIQIDGENAAEFSDHRLFRLRGALGRSWR
jgi:hypothetical protein